MAGRYFIVDAYTSRPFAGNPAEVCITDAPVTGSAHCVLGSYWQHLTRPKPVPRLSGIPAWWRTGG